MITGASKMDAGILVVSAADGAMPMTKEHILLCRHIGVKSIIVYLNKIDTVKDKELADVVEMEVRELLTKYEYDGEKAKVVRGSALCALNNTNPEIGESSIKNLLDIMDSGIELPPRDVDKPFFLSIDTTFNIGGRGTVATGTIETGKVKIGDDVELLGTYKPNIVTKVRGLETFRKQMESAEAGDNIGILLKNVLKKDICRGMCICQPGSRKAHNNFEANVYFLTTAEGGRKKPFATHYKPQMFMRTSDVPAIITLPSNVKMGMPGDNLNNLHMTLEIPIVLDKGERFALRESGKTIGAGIVTKLLEDIKQEKKVAEGPAAPKPAAPKDQAAPVDGAKPATEKPKAAAPKTPKPATPKAPKPAAPKSPKAPSAKKEGPKKAEKK